MIALNTSWYTDLDCCFDPQPFDLKEVVILVSFPEKYPLEVMTNTSSHIPEYGLIVNCITQTPNVNHNSGIPPSDIHIRPTARPGPSIRNGQVTRLSKASISY